MEDSMIKNLEKKYGKLLQEWTTIVNKSNLEKHGQIVTYLKSEYSLTHGYANLVAHKSLKSRCWVSCQCRRPCRATIQHRQGNTQTHL